jgi:hypothetical protein
VGFEPTNGGSAVQRSRVKQIIFLGDSVGLDRLTTLFLPDSVSNLLAEFASSNNLLAQIYLSMAFSKEAPHVGIQSLALLPFSPNDGRPGPQASHNPV